MTPLEVRRAAFTYVKEHGGNNELASAFIAGWEFGQNIAYEEVDNITPGFEEFWNLYDKKRGRDKAEKLWNKLSNSDKEAIMQYIPQYKMATPDKQFRKDPQTFLRNKSWNDELIFKTQQDEQQQRLNAYAEAIANIGKG